MGCQVTDRSNHNSQMNAIEIRSHEEHVNPNMKALYEVWDEVQIHNMVLCGWWNTTPTGCAAATSRPEEVRVCQDDGRDCFELM